MLTADVRLQGALGKLALVKDKTGEGIDKVRRKMGRNKDVQCRVHLKVRTNCGLLQQPPRPEQLSTLQLQDMFRTSSSSISHMTLSQNGLVASATQEAAVQ